MKVKTIKTLEGEVEGLPADFELARMVEARPEDIQYLLDTAVDSENGRSRWYWVRLPDGTLMLATMPQGDSYEVITQARGIGAL